MIVYENKDIHGDSDPVSIIEVKISCHPGQVEAINGFLRGVCSQGGVYSIEQEVNVEVQNGEQVLQQSSVEHQPTEVGTRSDAAESWESGPVDAGTHGEVAGTTGTETEGQV